MQLSLNAVSIVLFSAVIGLAQTTGAPAPVEGTPAPVVETQTPARAGAPDRPVSAPPSASSSADPAAAANEPAPQPPSLPAAKKAATPDSAAARAGKPYVLGPNDEVSIRVWGNQQLTSIYNVGPDGLLRMPLIGATKADGMTLEQLTDVISTKLADQIVTPEVNIEIVRVNSKKYYIMGEGAARGGEFPLTGPTTVSEAIAISGGIREFANTKHMYLLRGTKKFPFNYKDVIQGKHLEQDIQIENGDRIVIPQ